jgi:hypothetical protein
LRTNKVAIDTTLLKPENLLATSPSKAHTAVPTAIARVGTTDAYDYTFPNSWAEVGDWTISINSDGLSVAKGTVMGVLPVKQGTFYSFGMNWAAGESVEALSTKVTAVEVRLSAVEETNADLATSVNNVGTVNAGLDRRLGTVETSATNAGTRLDAIEEAQLLNDLTVGDHTTLIEALAQRIAALEAQMNP